MFVMKTIIILALTSLMLLGLRNFNAAVCLGIKPFICILILNIQLELLGVMTWKIF